MSEYPYGFLSAGDWFYVVVELVVVGITAARSRMNPFLLTLIITFAGITVFNITSPFKASYLSPLAVAAYISWLIYIAIIRAMFGRRRTPPLPAVEEPEIGHVNPHTPQ